MKSIFSLIALLFISTTSFAYDGEHTADVCSSLNTQICAHLGHMENLESGKKGAFVAHVTGPAEVTKMHIYLWMPSMGHGSAPMTVTQIAANKYQVTEVRFVMSGAWTVNLEFEADGQLHRLAFPFEIK